MEALRKESLFFVVESILWLESSSNVSRINTKCSPCDMGLATHFAGV
jgi:hypothetical protein